MKLQGQRGGGVEIHCRHSPCFRAHTPSSSSNTIFADLIEAVALKGLPPAADTPLSSHGGCVLLDGLAVGSVVRFQTVVFTSCAAEKGGAVALRQSTAVFINCTFSAHRAAHLGGALALLSSRV
jgi:hypothetical protein